MTRILLFSVTMLLLAGCVSVPFPPEAARPVPRGVGAAQLAAGSWRGQPGVFLLEQRAEFDFHGRKLEMRGMMKLDMPEGRARLVAVDDLGIKLFDLTVTRGGQTLHDELPQLAKYPQLAQGVAASVRRIFLVPRPEAGDRERAGATHYLLSRSWKGGELTFTFGGPKLDLQRVRASGGGRRWQVDYYQYHRQKGLTYPGGIVLSDNLAGYRLTLWLDSMRRTDE